jgi:hypothetical protein
VPTPSHPVLTVVLACLYGAFTVWTLIRLYHSPSENAQPIIYRNGVRGFGLTLWAVMTVMWTLRNRDPSWNVWARLLVVAFVMLPISLWAGYFWGSQMASFFGSGRNR